MVEIKQESGLEVGLCCRCDVKEECIRDIIKQIFDIQDELNNIKGLLDAYTGDPELKSFGTITKTRYHIDRITNECVYLKRKLKYLERELIEDDKYKV